MKSATFSQEEIKSAVRDRYASLVSEGGGCCSTPSQDLQQKGVLVQLAGYSPEQLTNLPTTAVTNSFGCGNPTALAEIQPGQTVLDIGSGNGIDCFLAADQVGPEGRVIGLDMTPEMIARATESARQAGRTNVEFRLGEAESMPVEDSSVDWIISNCVINLSPDKPKVFSEIARVLRPGGRFSISDIVLGEDLPAELVSDIRAWTGCVTGAIPESEYLRGLREAGLSEVRVDNRLVYEASTISTLLGSCCSGAPEGFGPVARQLSGKVWSALIVGRRA